MKIPFYIDPETDLPNIYKHDVRETEVEDVLKKPGEDRPNQILGLQLGKLEAADTFV